MTFDQWWLKQDTYFGNPWSSPTQDKALEKLIEDWCRIAYREGYNQGVSDSEDE